MFIAKYLSYLEISNAKLVVIVGSLGLASNFLGLFLFHGTIAYEFFLTH